MLFNRIVDHCSEALFVYGDRPVLVECTGRLSVAAVLQRYSAVRLWHRLCENYFQAIIGTKINKNMCFTFKSDHVF
jgi:hypothetical protein